MKAAVYTRYGPPDVIEIRDVPTPVPKDDEVLVRVHASTVAAADWRLRKAEPSLVRWFNGLTRPRRTILGMEFAGTVAAVGRSVTSFGVGDAVFGSTGFRFGAHAEYVVTGTELLAPKPANLSFDEAAAVLFGGISALHFLKAAKVAPGQRVLVYGASGSVGVFAVQLAKQLGANVTGVCSSANIDLVKSLGADAVIDYTRDDFSNAGRVYDVIIDTVGLAGWDRALRSLKRGGVFAIVGGKGGTLGFVGMLLRGVWTTVTGPVRVLSGTARGSHADVLHLKELIEAGKVRTVIDRRYPLEQIVEAHRLAEGGHKRGHVVVTVAT